MLFYSNGPAARGRVAIATGQRSVKTGFDRQKAHRRKKSALGDGSCATRQSEREGITFREGADDEAALSGSDEDFLNMAEAGLRPCVGVNDGEFGCEDADRERIIGAPIVDGLTFVVDEHRAISTSPRAKVTQDRGERRRRLVAQVIRRTGQRLRQTVWRREARFSAKTTGVRLRKATRSSASSRPPRSAATRGRVAWGRSPEGMPRSGKTS